ncbi:MAG: sigma-54-dependent Fis family transcriptional regulator [Deltaproteobacteria bacterium]|nr:sigma-54-dependent Fis family transcriptional regulator [Deltaproteobacteria bacterium]
MNERRGEQVGVLLADDEEASREVLSYHLGELGLEVDAVPDGRTAIGRFDSGRHRLVVTDLKMPHADGMAVLRHVQERSAATPVIVVTAFASIPGAVAAMRAGAYDFIGKPFDREQLGVVVRRALERVRLLDENRRLREEREARHELVFRSGAMAETLDVVDRVAPGDASVLITGESGTGKELIARRLHARSKRAGGPFVAVSCSAIPAELFESELFGHVRGAFTGATRDRRGRFASADGGTLFLDEVGDLPAPMQTKLLRVLQERVVDAVGSDRPQPVDVRVVSATNRALAELIDVGGFRTDLFYRLNVVEVRVPPLRERADDIEPLVRRFVARFAGERELEVPEEVLAELRRRPWPGNVRELENACERAVLLCRGDRLRVEDLPAAAGPEPAAWPPLPPDGLPLIDLEVDVIRRALELHGWNRTKTAAYLRIPRHVLIYRLEKHGLRQP